MNGKFPNLPIYLLAKLRNKWIRAHLRGLVSWTTPSKEVLEPGCTVVLGVCSKLQEILLANLTCLNRCRWPALKETILVLDKPNGILKNSLQATVLEKLQGLRPRFLFYSEKQAQVAEQLKQPWIYAWLSWCIGFSQVKTRCIFIHDYDALILDEGFKVKYDAFLASDCKIQGIEQYSTNGILREDNLMRTFEAFVDTAWIRSFNPIALANRVAIYKKRTVDFDALLDIQANFSKFHERLAMPVASATLIHPTQMIDQYTRHSLKRRNFRYRPWPHWHSPCYSLPLIPFFYFLSGEKNIFINAINAIKKDNPSAVRLLGGKTTFDLRLLTREDVDRTIQQMIKGFTALKMTPFEDVLNYASALFAFTKASEDRIWDLNLTEDQKQWLRESSQKMKYSA